nr:hypothetical protein [Tanacetum cinerariifolium]
MISILEKSEHNVDFHQIVDFVEASHIRYALTINPTVYVSHIRQFWSTARIEKTNEGTKILTTVDGKPRTISESSIRRNLKLNDKEGISSLPDVDLFENLALMGYTILPNQKFTFQKGQFSHQWKFLIYTIMQCLSPKSIGFNEFSSNISTAMEEAGVERSIEQGSNDTEELLNVLTSMDAVNILTSGVQDVSVPPAAEVSTVGVPTASGPVPTVSAIFTAASVVTSYSRRKGKEKMVESDTPKKKKLQEQINVQMAREMEEQMAREDQRMDEQIARDAEIARIHAEEELQMLIDGLDRNNEIITKYLQELSKESLSLRRNKGNSICQSSEAMLNGRPNISEV